MAVTEGGDDLLAFLVHGASAVIACAVEPLPLALLELKLAAVRTLPLHTVLTLFGFDEAGRRVFLYHYVRNGEQEGRGPPPPGMSPLAAGEWDSREELIRRGLAAADPARPGFDRLWRGLRLAGLGPATAAALRGEAPFPSESRRWRLLTRRILGQELGSLVCERLPALVDAGHPLGRYVLVGSAAEPGSLHAWLSPDGHAALQEAGPVQLALGPTEATLGEQPEASLDLVDLGASALAPTLLAAARRALQPGGAVLVRSITQPELSGWRVEALSTWADLRPGSSFRLHPD